MSRAAKILIAAEANPAGLAFSELRTLAEAAGWVLTRIHGDHHVFARENTPEIINLQPTRGKAKTYQVRQVLGLIERYKIDVR